MRAREFGILLALAYFIGVYTKKHPLSSLSISTSTEHRILSCLTRPESAIRHITLPFPPL